MKYTIFNNYNFFLNDIVLKNFDEITKYVSKYFNLNAEKTFDVNIIADDEMQLLNFQYRYKNKTTDVLSFSFSETPVKLNLLGEIYIAYPYVQMQAKIFNVTFEQELSFLFLHGILHLLGYSHKIEEEKIKMFSLQIKILNDLNIIKSI